MKGMELIDNKFELEDIVYLIVDEDQKAAMVIGITIRVGGNIIYDVQGFGWGGDFYGFQLTKEKNLAFSL